MRVITRVSREKLLSLLEKERCDEIDAIVHSAGKSDCQVLFKHLLVEPSAFVRQKIINMLGYSTSENVIIQAAAELSSAETVIRNAALEVLVLQGVRAIPVLAKLMTDPSQDVRKMAADALGRINSDSAVELLIDGLSDKDTNVVIACAEGLGERGYAKAIPALAAALKREDNFWICFAVMGALSKFENSEVMRIIDDYIDERRWAVQETSILLQHWSATVVKFGDQTLLDKALGMYAAHGLSATNLLEILCGYIDRGEQVDTGKPILRKLLPVAVRNLPDLYAVHKISRYFPSVIWDLAPILIDKFSGTLDAREHLVGIFLLLDPQEQKVCELLQQGSENVCKVMVSVAEQSGLHIPFAIIEKLAFGADVEMLSSLILLSRRCGQAAKGFLQELSQYPDEEVQRLALDSICLLETAEPSEGLIKALVHTSEEVRAQAVKGLLALGPALFSDSLYKLFAQSPDEIKPDILAVAIGWSIPEVSEMLEAAMAISDSSTRAKVVKVCRSLDNEALFLHMVKTMVNDSDDEVRRAVIISLSHRRGAKVYEYLAYLYAYDPCKENRYFILNCDEIYDAIHAELTWIWLEENIRSNEHLLQLAAVKGLLRLGECGREFLAEFMDTAQCDEVITEFIRQRLAKDGRLDDGIKS